MSATARCALPIVALLALVCGAPDGAPAQSTPRGAAPDLNDLARQWARGDFRSPLICDFGGRPRRGLRRILIAPGPRRAHPPVLRVRFFSLEAQGATRCFGELGGEELDLVGSLFVTHSGPARRDMALREFKEALRRERGFSYEITRGSLRVSPVGDAGGEARTVALDGGRLRLTQVHPGSDEARVLADLASPRKLSLSLEAPGGERFRFPLILADTR